LCVLIPPVRRYHVRSPHQNVSSGSFPKILWIDIARKGSTGIRSHIRHEQYWFYRLYSYPGSLINPKGIGATLSLFSSFSQLALKNTSGPECGDCNSKRQTHSKIISYFRFFPVQMETPEPSDYEPGYLGWFWRMIFVVSIIAWIGGGLTVWRGAHIADDFLSGGLVLIGVGLCFMVLGLWLLHKVFTKVNPPTTINTVPQQYVLTSSNYWGTVSAIRRPNMAPFLDRTKQVAVISALAEGSGIRQIERITGVHRDTIMRLGVRVGKGCAGLLDRKMRNLTCQHLQFDELWGFIGKKERHCTVDDDPTLGDVWTFCAIDSDTKLVPSFRVGKRDSITANAFVADVASRMAVRVQISSDALRAYVDAVELAFGANVDFAQVIKSYTQDESITAERKYSASDFVIAEKKAISGFPDMALASTSHVERLNGTTRLHMRRLTRLTYAFSKKKENFEAAVALHFAYYNFVKRHNTLRATPAMAAGIERDFWTVGNLIEAAA
jgi:IS1 family transposase